MDQQINHLQTFLSMHGYGVFIWPSYTAMLLLFGMGVYVPLRRYRKLMSKLRSKI